VKGNDPTRGVKGAIGADRKEKYNALGRGSAGKENSIERCWDGGSFVKKCLEKEMRDRGSEEENKSPGGKGPNGAWLLKARIGNENQKIKTSGGGP